MVYETGDRIPHDDYYELAGGTIPFNLTVGTSNNIRCQHCNAESPEDEYEWTDTNVYADDVADDGTVRHHDVQSVTLRCPACDKEFTAY